MFGVVSSTDKLKPITEKGHIFFTDGDLLKLFLPLIIEQALKYSLGLADSIMVAGIGEAAVSGVSLIHFLMSFINGLFSALMIGGATIIGQYIGNRTILKARDACMQLICLTTMLAILLTTTIYLTKPFILSTLFGKIPQDVYNYADTYLSITAASIPFLALYSAGAVIFRCMGNTRIPMKIMLVMNIINIGVNGILVYSFKAGIVGISTTTLLTRIAAAVVIFIFLMNKKHLLSLSFAKRLRIDIPMMRRIMGIGIPCGMENGTFYFGRILVVGMVATFGTASIAANSVAGIIILFQVIPGMAITLGTPVVIARCVGANDYRQAQIYIKKIIGIIYKTHLISCVSVILLLPAILNIYNLSEEARLLTCRIVWLHALFTVFLWPLSYGLPSAFRASGDARYPMKVSMLCMLLCRITFSYILGVYFNMGLIGIWLGMFIDWIAKALIFVYRFINGKWMCFRSI